MLRTMRIKITEEPLERSFIQQQLIRKTTKSSSHGEIPPLSIEEGLNRNFVYHAIITALDSLKIHLKKKVNLHFQDCQQRDYAGH